LLYGLVLLVALAALVASFAWVAARAGQGVGGGFGPGMMGYAPGGGERVETLDAAREQARLFADRLELRTDEVMRFADNYYVQLNGEDGRPATEVLVDPATGAVWIEYGPAMMWNTRYGMMARGHMSRGGAGGGMMGGGMMSASADPTWAPDPRGSRPTVSAEEAVGAANRWLRRAADTGALRAEEPVAFPGYYTLHTVRGDRLEGMLSVNAYTGAVWPHWWHGRFISMSE
jgi:hypothetical protein